MRGPAQVIFGSASGALPRAGGSFVAQAWTRNVTCSNSTFGDPDPGHSKACWYGPLPTSTAGKILSTGGSDYPFYVQNYEQWDNNQRTVVGQYHLAPGLVQVQLQQMYRTGQRNVALVVWYMPYGSTDTPINGVVDGAFLDSSSGQLSSQAQQNLTAILKLIQRIGFSQITLRFAPVGNASPASWGNTWNELQFEQDESFEFSTRRLAETALATSQITRVYDLGVEMAGIPHNLNNDGITYSDGQSPEWTSRLWKDYVAAFGEEDSYGFSIAYSPGTLTTAVAEYDRAGKRPHSYAIDTTIPSDLWNYYQELEGAGDANKPLVIQETSYDDVTQMAGIAAEIAHFPLTISYIDQWPVSTSVANADASPPADYGAFGGSTGPSGTLYVPPCTLAAGQASCTSQASWSTSNAADVALLVNGVAVPNATYISSSASGTAPVSLGLTPSTFVLSSSQGILSGSSAVPNSSLSSPSSSSNLATLSVAAIDPLAPVITLAGLGGDNNQAIWAIGSNMLGNCTALLYDAGYPSRGPLATINNPNCAGGSISFQIPKVVSGQYKTIEIIVTTPGNHASIPYLVELQSVPLLTVAGVGGNNNTSIWAIGNNISLGCHVTLYDPSSTTSTPLVTISDVSCQPNSLSFAIPSFIYSNYSRISMSVLNSDGQASPALGLMLGR